MVWSTSDYIKLSEIRNVKVKMKIFSLSSTKKKTIIFLLKEFRLGDKNKYSYVLFTMKPMNGKAIVLENVIMVVSG